MAGHGGGPWGGGSGGNGGDERGDRGQRPTGGQRPGAPQGQMPEIDELMKKGQDRLKVLFGGKDGGGPTGSGGAGGSGGGIPRGMIGIGALVALVLWGASSFYTVRPEEQSVELFLGKCNVPCIGEPGLNFAPWPVVTAEVLPVRRENTEDIGTGPRGDEGGLMLTGDENIVDIDYQVVWNITDPSKFLFNLREPRETIRAVSESAMREIIAQSELAPILNRDRGPIADRLKDLIQSTLDSYDSGVNIVRVNFDKADPPEQVKAAYFAVQSASQERDRLEKRADAYANQKLAAARGEAAEVLEEAEGYRARVVNEAEGEASRFTAVLEEYRKAPEVTRKRLYIEAMEEVLGGVNKVILGAEGQGNQGVVPYLPLNELRPGSQQGGSN